MSSGDDYLAFSLGTAFGVIIFFKGFKILREYRVLADTPEIPIRSVAMGLVEIHGQAVGDEFLISPVSRTPCYYYKTIFERWEVDDKGNGKWSHCHTDEETKGFYLQDSTGKILIESWDSQLDLEENLCREVIGVVPSAPPAAQNTKNVPGSPLSDTQLLDYLAEISQRSSSLLTGLVQFSAEDTPEKRMKKARRAAGKGMEFLKQIAAGGNPSFDRAGAAGKFRVRETCILRGREYDVTGTCAENPRPKDEHDRNKIEKGKNEPTFLISSRSEKQAEGRLRRRAALYIFGGAAMAVGCLAMVLNKLGWL
jgi:hypothetical protein